MPRFRSKVLGIDTGKRARLFFGLRGPARKSDALKKVMHPRTPVWTKTIDGDAPKWASEPARVISVETSRSNLVEIGGDQQEWDRRFASKRVVFWWFLVAF